MNKYNPDILWADSGDALGPGSYIGSQEFLAWLYNESPVKDIVAINDRYIWAFMVLIIFVILTKMKMKLQDFNILYITF